jgi:hypothetical protein
MLKIWKEIEGHSGYWVSNYGEIISYRKGNTKKLDNIPVLLKYRNSSSRKGKNYYSVQLNKKNYYIHRLVASAFILNPENKNQVNHIDNNPKNNRVDNLEWVTQSENMIHSLNFKSNYENLGLYISRNKKRFKFFKRLKTGNIYQSFNTLEEAQQFAKQYY